MIAKVFRAIFGSMKNLIGAALRKARREANLKQKDLASVLGLSPQFLSEIEHGGRRLPEDRYALLPHPIRDAVIDAAKGELRDQIARLEQIRKEPSDADTGC